jgi:hypothetical protein
MTLPKSVAIGGALAQRSGFGGHAWVFLQYLIGFRRLGYDVVFVDQAEGADRAWISRVLAPLGVPYILIGDDEARREAVARVGEAELLLNVMGFVADEDVLDASHRLVFLDIDPGFGQMWSALGLADIFSAHEVHVTVGERIGGPDCAVPTCGLDWIPTRPPVVLDEWPAAAPIRGAPFTSVATWRGPFGPIEYRGRTYGLRVHEFRKFVELPRRSSGTFELALDIDPADERDVELLRERQWRLADPRHVAGDPAAYRDYIRRSRGEFMVAKNLYVETQGGWFSDRSACYLASGKPVLAQDTGIADLYPNGEGLLRYSTLDEAIDGVERIAGSYDRHCSAAREIAEEYFDSDKVLKRLLDRLGVD